MKKYYCPICGYELDKPYGTGYICNCCFNECGFDDDFFIKYEIDMLEYDKITTRLATLGLNGHDVIKEIQELGDKVRLPQNDVWAILRQEWVKNGYTFGADYEKFKPLELEKARKQLLNIGVNLEDVLKVQYKYHRR